MLQKRPRPCGRVGMFCCCWFVPVQYWFDEWRLAQGADALRYRATACGEAIRYLPDRVKDRNEKPGADGEDLQ